MKKKKKSLTAYPEIIKASAKAAPVYNIIAIILFAAAIKIHHADSCRHGTVRKDFSHARPGYVTPARNSIFILSFLTE